MPVLIGWAAVTNSISWVAVAFFLVIFFWTPPHFWALAIKYKDDYEAASIPMLPVIAERNIVLKNMWFYTVAMIASSIALIYLADLQWWAMVVTVGLGLVFAFQLFALKENSENYNSVAAKIFHWSITYLTLFSALLVVGQLLKA
jgi:protoheme IX farnesyltransferase